MLMLCICTTSHLCGLHMQWYWHYMCWKVYVAHWDHVNTNSRECGMKRNVGRPCRYHHVYWQGLVPVQLAHTLHRSSPGCMWYRSSQVCRLGLELKYFIATERYFSTKSFTGQMRFDWSISCKVLTGHWLVNQSLIPSPIRGQSCLKGTGQGPTCRCGGSRSCGSASSGSCKGSCRGSCTGSGI